jgi:flavin-binding protein dodecin
MPGTYRISEMVGTSPESFAAAAKVAVAEASKTLSKIDWFEVVEMRGHVKDGNIDEFQVKVKMGYRG